MTNDSEKQTIPCQQSTPTPPFSSSRRRFDRVHVAETLNCGLGVYSDVPIKAGRAVGQLHGEIKSADYRSHYCVEFADAVLEPTAPYRFLNHCCEPNCEFIEWETNLKDEGDEVKKVYELWVHALRNIEKGEELTVDYAWDWQSAIPCKCGSPNCRGWICKIDELDVCRNRRGEPENRWE